MRILLVNVWVCAGAALLFPWLGTPARVAAALIVYAAFRTPLIPLVNGMVLAAVGGRPQAYAALRMWGTVGYVVTAVAAGILADHVGLTLAVQGVGVSLLVCGVINWVGRSGQPGDLPPARAGDILAVLRDRRMLVLLGATALARVSFGPYTVFFTIHLGEIGFSRTFAGLSWAAAAGSELVVMACWARLWPLMSARRWLAVAIGAHAVRWLLFIPARDPVSLILIQCTHAFTFGVFYLAAVELVDALVPRTLRATAQGVFSSATFGVGSFLGNFLGGLLYPALGMTWLYAVAAAVATVATGVYWLGGRIAAPTSPAAAPEGEVS
jgi:PPP family 3-phenylpropionic acid transporter